jgi:hypothetical protein
MLGFLEILRILEEIHKRFKIHGMWHVSCLQDFDEISKNPPTDRFSPEQIREGIKDLVAAITFHKCAMDALDLEERYYRNLLISTMADGNNSPMTSQTNCDDQDKSLDQTPCDQMNSDHCASADAPAGVNMNGCRVIIAKTRLVSFFESVMRPAFWSSISMRFSVLLSSFWKYLISLFATARKTWTYFLRVISSWRGSV